MRVFLFLLLAPFLNAWSQNLPVIQKMTDKISDQSFQSCFANPESTCQITDGSVFANEFADQFSGADIQNAANHAASTSCGDQRRPSNEHDNGDGTVTETKVLLVSEISGGPEKDESVTSGDYYSPGNVTFDSRQLFLKSGGSDNNWPIDKLVEQSKAAPTDVQRRTNLIEGLVQYTRLSAPMSDPEVEHRWATAINSYTSDDNEKEHLLSMLSTRLYYDYNDLLNPLQNKNHDPQVPKTDLSLHQLMTADGTDRPNESVVCNGITEGVAKIGEEVFKGTHRDVLGINDGSHFAAVIHEPDGKNTIINWHTVRQNADQAVIDPNIASANTRVFKMENGKFKEIATIDTELGAGMKKFFVQQVPTMASGHDPSVAFVEAEKVVKDGDTTDIYNLKTGTAQTSNARLYIMVGQITHQKKGFSYSTGIGTGIQKMTFSNQENVLLHIYAGVNQRLIRYQNEHVHIEGATGLELNASNAWQVVDDGNPTNDITPVSTSVNLNQTLSIKNVPNTAKSPSYYLKAQVVETLGSADEGAKEAKQSQPEFGNYIMGSFQNLGLYTGQINGQAGVDVPVGPRATWSTQANYQGSNIGQRGNVRTGISIVSQGKWKIFTFIGYANNNMGGYKTYGSLINQEPSGGFAGGGVQSIKTGATLSGQANGLMSNNPTQGQINLSIPLFRRQQPR